MNKINLGLIGFGTIGTGVVKLLQKNWRSIYDKTDIKLNFKKIADIDIKRNRGINISKYELTTDAYEIINDKDIDIVIELIGGIKKAKEFIIEALKKGKHIVTANKALLSQYGDLIFKYAKKYKRFIGFEASVAGSIPIIKVIRESFIANKIQKIYGIINGTTNFILTKMEEENLSFQDALKLTQKLGFAEADSTFDIKGIDAAHKLQILASYAFNTNIDFKKIYYEGIDKIELSDILYVRDLGYKIKLLGIIKCKSKKIECRVHPTLIPQTHLLASIRNEFNAIYIEGDAIGSQLFYGKGAGSLPTASAVISDIVDIAKKIINNNKYFEKFYKNSGKEIIEFSEIKSRYYLKFHTVDEPGVLSKISGLLGKHNISLSSVLQKETGQKIVPIVMLTHIANEIDIQKAIKEINKLSIVKKRTKIIRIEDNY